MKQQGKSYLLRFRANDRGIFKAIQNNTKTVETRAATKRYQNMKAGDTLKLVCGNDTAEKTVTKATIFKDIEALLRNYTVHEINPNVDSKEELIKMYKTFPGYIQKISEFGILAIELEP